MQKSNKTNEIPKKTKKNKADKIVFFEVPYENQ